MRLHLPLVDTSRVPYKRYTVRDLEWKPGKSTTEWVATVPAMHITCTIRERPAPNPHWGQGYECCIETSTEKVELKLCGNLDYAKRKIFEIFSFFISKNLLDE